MDRRLYSNYFSDCTYYLANEVSQLTAMKQEINRVLISDAASEFSNAYLREKYNIILQSINEKCDGVINHQIYLGKRKAYLHKDDSDKAEKLDLIMDDFEIVRTKISQMAENIYESAYALAGGDIGLDAIISQEELRVSIAINEELGNLTYDEFFAMGENDRNAIVNRAIELADKYVLDGTLPVPENGRIELPIVPGVTIYCTGSTYATIGNTVVSVDYNLAAHDACLHILGGDVFANTDVSASIDLERRITHTEPIDENSFIYVAAGYNNRSNAFFVEKGVNFTTDSVKTNGVSVNTTCTVGCGVEVSCPSGWNSQTEPAIDYSLESVLNSGWVKAGRVVLGLLIAGKTVVDDVITGGAGVLNDAVELKFAFDLIFGK